MSKRITLKELLQAQKTVDHIRLFSILAHVDHGKTTLSDSLISSNGIISPRLAGDVRYLDYLESEKNRCITMKSSSISLVHTYQNERYLMNLIDSPGHIDFSNEVSAAVRLTDGAIIVVDVVEEVCVQTQVVLRQAWNEGLKPILVLNKIDKLITKLKMSPQEAYYQINKVIEQVNAVIGSLSIEETVVSTENDDNENVNKNENENENENNKIKINSTEIDLEQERKLFFSIENKNIAFASFIDGWAFTIEIFAEMYSKKMKMNKKMLERALFGEYYLHPKTGRIQKTPPRKKSVPMFVQFILNPIWELYNKIYFNIKDQYLIKENQQQLEKMIQKLNLIVKKRELLPKHRQSVIKSIFSKWIPISRCILDLVITHLPSPDIAQKTRIPRIWKQMNKKINNERFENAILNCDPNPKNDCFIYVGKIFSANPDSIEHIKKMKNRMTREEALKRLRQRNKETKNQNETKTEKDKEEEKESEKEKENENEKDKEKENEHMFVCFSRIFSGVIKTGSEIHVLLPKYNPEFPKKYSKTFKINKGDLYLLMGDRLELVDEVPAGNIFGIGGEIAKYIPRTGTLTTNKSIECFPSLMKSVKPIVRVAIEPKNPLEQKTLLKGLKLLNQSDSSVEIVLQKTGEYVIIATGEVHMDRCLEDLKKNIAESNYTLQSQSCHLKKLSFIPSQRSLRFSLQIKNVKSP